MAKVFEKSLFFRMGEGFMTRSIRLGLAPKGAHLLSVEEPESGDLRSTPVTVIENEGSRWLVAPYGETRWVRNARAAGWVQLQRGRRTDAVAATRPAVPAALEKRGPTARLRARAARTSRARPSTSTPRPSSRSR